MRNIQSFLGRGVRINYKLLLVIFGRIMAKDWDGSGMMTVDFHGNIGLSQMLEPFPVNSELCYCQLPYTTGKNRSRACLMDNYKYEGKLHSLSVTLVINGHNKNKTEVNDIPITFLSQITDRIYQMTTNNPCNVSEVYQVLDKTVTNRFGICSENELYQVIYSRERRRNFNQATVSVVTYDVEGILGSVDPSSGIMQGHLAAESTLRDLQFLFNFKVKLDVMINIDGSNDEYFHPLANQLNSGKAELGIGYFYVVGPRAELATPLIPLASDGLYAFFAQPPSNSVRNIYTVPLKWDIPAFVVTSLIFIGLVIVLFNNILGPKSTAINFYDMLLWTVSSLCQSGYNLETNKFWVKVLSFTGAILGYSMYAIYSGKLLSVLVAPITPVQQVNDLMQYGYTFYTIPALKHVVFNSEANLKPRPPPTGLEWSEWGSSLVAVLNERHVHIDVKLESMNGFLWFIRRVTAPLVRPSDHELCDKVAVLKYSNSTVFLANGFYVPKTGSQFRGHLNLGIVKIRELGLMKRYLKFTGPAGLDCVQKQKAYQEHLGLADVFSAILLFFVLFLISGIFFLAEVFLFGKTIK